MPGNHILAHFGDAGEGRNSISNYVRKLVMPRHGAVWRFVYAESKL